VTVRLDRPNPKVLPGMTAEVSFRFRNVEGGGGIVVPAEAVAEDRLGNHVFLVQPTGEGLGTVRRRDVTVGELVSGGLQITDGLRPGDRVVTAGVSQIEDGQQVRLLEPNQD
jgi:RND family efflux transporter MFP subunit